MTLRMPAYSVLVVLAVILGVGLANLLFTSSQVHEVQAAQVTAARNAAAVAAANAKLRQQLSADCASDRDLAGLPLANTTTGRPSELGVRIISNARTAWTAHGCPGQLPPPDPTFTAGARLYHVPAS